jgi:glycosyltransferase involved in cell wall biosynthesis
MNDVDRRYNYDDPVRFEISESELASYRRAADFINVGGFGVLCLQHEYGIFGGKAGAHILDTLERVTMPIVTTLHTVLEDPSIDQHRVMDEILRLSSRVVVMSRNGAELLKRIYGVPSQKIDVIPHGIPVLPDREASRVKLHSTETTQLLTFGLLSPDKGLEYVIDALPRVVARFPQVKYAIVGATHPRVKEFHGETYRRSLQLRAHKLGVNEHVVFHDRFVSARELGEFLAAADVYLTPYLNPEQITSGTLAYAVGTGKAVISTPYRYAKELLAQERGVLVPMRDSDAIASALMHLLEQPEELRSLGERAAAYGQGMSWISVAKEYKSSFFKAQENSTSQRRVAAKRVGQIASQVELPELNLRHVHTLSDSTGILQHAIYSVPRYEDGYCIDDNARALLLMTLLDEGGAHDPTATRTLSSSYLAFVSHAFNEGTSRFRNFMSYSRSWLEESGSEDSHGRTIWALGTVVGRSTEPGRRALARRLFLAALPVVGEFGSPRAWAFSLLGIAEYLRAFEGDREAENLQRDLASRLVSGFSRNFDQPWPWCEDKLTYDNARLPQALIVSARGLKDDELMRSGVAALGWLSAIQVSESGAFAPIGSNGFYRRGETKAQFDQQPVDACATISACLDAWRATGDEIWAQRMWGAFSWFLGENDAHVSLYDPSTRGCRDGLHSESANENQGAESTLSFLLSLVDMRTLAAEMRLNKGSSQTAAQVPERAH